jgi:predicted PilT family ATPase
VHHLLQVKLIGAPRCIADAKSWLTTVHESRVILNIPVALVPAVIGTKGANFTRITKDYSVEIDTKPADESGDLILTVWGVDPLRLETAR